MTTTQYSATALLLGLGFSTALLAQVSTEIPPPIAGAKPVGVEHIKIHGAALEGNLEGDAVDRDVFVFLPPGYSVRAVGYSYIGRRWTGARPSLLASP